MPYCTQCGQQVAPTARFCAKCGAAQPVAASAPAQSHSWLDTVDSRTASILCYIPVLGVVACVVVLAAHRFRGDREARFHASQGLYLFVGWLILDWGLKPFLAMLPFAGFYALVLRSLKALLVVTWIFMIVKASQREAYRLPIIGDLAERSMAEQQ
ncbi:MAG: zinc-ribbon domain-containing protein [Bryobacterales bacterium]|nr:zinc-ribbon domain-containing protein [Bryobacterales bacterium]